MNRRQAQVQTQRNVVAFLKHLASLPSGSVLGNLELMAKAQFMEGMTGRVFNSVVGKAHSPRALEVAISKMMLDVDPLVDPSQSVWTKMGTSMYRTAWMMAQAVVKPFGLEGSDVLAEDMVRAVGSASDAAEDGSDPRGSLFWRAGKASREKAEDIVSGNIELADLLGLVKAYSKNLSRNYAARKKTQDKADAAAVADGFLPGVLTTDEGEQMEVGDFDADTLSTGTWGSIIAAVLANPRTGLAQDVFGWLLDWVEETGELTELEKRVVSTVLTEISTTGSIRGNDADLARDFGVSPSFISQLMKAPSKANGYSMGRFPAAAAKAIKREHPAFIDKLENVMELSNLARGGAGAWKAPLGKVKYAADEKVLRAKLIRLASERKDLRPVLLPLLAKSAGKDSPSKPMHIAGPNGTLCGISKEKAQKQDLPVVSAKDAASMDRSNWCPKCADKAGLKGSK